MRVKTSVAAALVAICAILPGAAPADAASGSLRFARGDAPPRIDLVHLSARNAPGRSQGSVRVANLGSKGKFTLGWFDDAYTGLALDVTYENHRAHLKVFRLTEDSSDRVRCAGARASWSKARDVVTVSAPRSCGYRSMGGTLDFYAFSKSDGLYDDPERTLRLRVG